MAKTEITVDVDVNKLAREEAGKWTVVINLVGYKGFLLRLKIAAVLVRFACWIAGMNYEEDQHVISLKKARIE